MRGLTMILGGELDGTVVPTDLHCVDVMEQVGTTPYYDASGKTRPFVMDREVRSLPVERVGITVHVVRDGVEQEEVFRHLNDTVQGLFFSRWVDR